MIRFSSHDFDDPELQDCYKNDQNYRVEYDKDNRNGKCFVFCSSNGLYECDNEISFHNKVILQDRYEWTSVAKSIKAEKKIFIRDIFLSWYAKGINVKQNSIPKVVELIKEETSGYKIYFCGVSTGGYLSSILSSYIASEACFNFSGQYSLWKHLDHTTKNPILRECRNKEFFDIAELVGHGKTKQIYYFYPTLVDHDIVQKNHVSKIPRIITIGIRSRHHGSTIWANEYPLVLNNISELSRSLDGLNGKEVSRFVFALTVFGYAKAFRDLNRWFVHTSFEKIRFFFKANH